MTLLDEWVAKAEADYAAAVSLNRRRRTPLPGIVAFHCQQCAEKYLKAYLVSQGSAPPRTHDLRDLQDLCAALDSSFLQLTPELLVLNPYAVDIRYPGISATQADAHNAVKAVRRVRKAMRRTLGL